MILRSLLVGLVALTGSAQAQPDSTVRVRILAATSPPTVEVESLGPGNLWIDDVASGSLAPGASVRIHRSGDAVSVEVDGHRLSGTRVRLESDELRLRAGRIDRRYPARLEAHVVEGTLALVNHAPMEPYVASVVASELNFRDLEAAKAQAVLARTYAATRSGRTPHFDLTDGEASQVYRGLDTITPTSRQAAAETAGQVLTYHGDLADVYYFSSSGGQTANNESIWRGPPIPYLRGVPDPYDQGAPDHSWRTSASRPAVLNALSARYGGRVHDVRVERRSPRGRVLAVRLEGSTTPTITGNQLRQTVNATAGARTVRSTRYDITTEGDRLVFTGGGFGHGVGMSQYGALGQARAGRSYREILAHYFLGTDVTGGGPSSGSLVAVDVPRAPGAPESALRTRYRPPTARRWPTPRRLVASEATTSPPPGRESPARARRTAW